MCGILAAYGTTDLELAKKQASKLSHRGPDEKGHYLGENGILCHERLSIMDIHTGKQPIEGDSGAYLIHNGEIYNHLELKQTLKQKHTQRTKSDSEIILHLYQEKGVTFLNKLDGVFAFVILDKDQIFAARDPIGVKPLFYGKSKDGSIWFASETKALIDVCESIDVFPPGHYYTSETGFVRYYTPEWFQGKTPTKDSGRINALLTKAVKKRLMSDVPLGVLLSGGLDSSLVTSIVVREMKKIGKTVKSFSVGLSSQCQDLKKAKLVADFLGTEHHEVIFTPQQGIDLLKELIKKVETYDVTTIRASTPMYIMSEYIKKQGVKVVLSGEGADEIFGGYLYFGQAPSQEEFHKECIRRVKRLHTSDVQRADRATMGMGIEARVPFLDLEFLNEALLLDPKLKVISKGHRMEKHVLREAFDDQTSPYLPDEVLWRQKEQFSDGVGYSWIDSLIEYASEQVSDEELQRAHQTFPHNTPETKEALLYRKIFQEHFPHKDSEKLVLRWIPKWQENKDPSGRANKSHIDSYEQAKATNDEDLEIKLDSTPLVI